MDDFRIPDGIEPIVGYRRWRYTLGLWQAQLQSLSPVPAALWRNEKSSWEGNPSGWVTATCFLDTDSGHVAPVEDCTCGLYAVKRLDELLLAPSPRLLRIQEPTEQSIVQRRLAAAGVTAAGVVMGRVQLAGKVIEHEYGFRAERARIAEFLPVRGTEPTIIRLAAQLGLAVGPSLEPRYGPDSPDPHDPSSPQRRIGDWIRPAA
jgi:hypothetical protein